MPKHIVSPGDGVLLTTRVGKGYRCQVALVLAVYPVVDSSGRHHRLETVHVDHEHLRLAGTSEYYRVFTHLNDVVHVSHPDFLSGKVSTGYETMEYPTDSALAPSEDVAKTAEKTQAEENPKPSTDDVSQPPKPTDYVLFVDGVQKGDAVTHTANIKKADGEIVSVADLAVGDVLEDGLTVKEIVPVPDNDSVNILTVHAAK